MKGQRIVGLLLNFRDAVRSAECITSLLEEEVSSVLVLDNSEDNGKSAADIVAIYKGDSRVKVVVSERNLGFAAGVNRGIKTIQEMFPGAWVLLINNDARLLSGASLKLEKVLVENANALIAFPSISQGDRVLGQAYYHKWLGLLSWRPRHGFFPFASGCCLLIAMDRMSSPLFDEDFFMYGEDCELGWRLSQQKGAMLHVNEVLVVHHGSASSRLGSLFYESHTVAAHLILARKLARNELELALLLTMRALCLPARGFVRTIRFFSLKPLRGLWDGFRLSKATTR
jgi:GT2 family glycosyltransferase